MKAAFKSELLVVEQSTRVLVVPVTLSVKGFCTATQTVVVLLETLEHDVIPTPSVMKGATYAVTDYGTLTLIDQVGDKRWMYRKQIVKTKVDELPRECLTGIARPGDPLSGIQISAG